MEEPVPLYDPFYRSRHPAATVTSRNSAAFRGDARCSLVPPVNGGHGRDRGHGRRSSPIRAWRRAASRARARGLRNSTIERDDVDGARGNLSAVRRRTASASTTPTLEQDEDAPAEPSGRARA